MMVQKTEGQGECGQKRGRPEVQAQEQGQPASLRGGGWPGNTEAPPHASQPQPPLGAGGGPPDLPFLSQPPGSCWESGH